MYYPKNKIITNLYTQDNKLIYLDDRTIYKGFYWKTHEGKFYTGKNPNDRPIRELIEIKDTESNFNPNFPQSQIAFTDAPLELEFPQYDSELLIEYNTVRGVDVLSQERKILPYSITPSPTPRQYEIGEFKRYFIKKSNENKFIEIDKNQYDNLKSRNSGWLWQLYLPFELNWKIKGDKNLVGTTNKNTVMFISKKFNLIFFDKFLKENYLRFWRS